MTLTLPATPKDVMRGVAQLQQFCRERDVPEKAVHALMLCVEEVARLKVENMLAYFDKEQFKDWTHADTGAPVLKAQHPEFEMWNQGIHARSGVSCADCHMPYKREGALKISDHHVRSPKTVGLDRGAGQRSGRLPGLVFSYGVHPVNLAEEPGDWREFAAGWLPEDRRTSGRVLLVAGPSSRNPEANHRLELMRIGRPGG